MQRRDGNGITFVGTLADCDIYAVGKGYQLSPPNKARNAAFKALFSGAISSGSSRGLQIREQDYRLVLQVDCRLPSLQQRSSFSFASSLLHLNEW